MTMYRRILAVVSVVLVVAAVGGFLMLKTSAVGPTTAADRAQVTGYATSNAMGQTTGAVSVSLGGEPAARIDRIVAGLPQANLDNVCADNSQEYRISFTAYAGPGVRRGFGLTGYGCGNLVVEVPSHGLPVDRIDRYCSLFRAVRRLLPASASATHSGTCASAGSRLFVASPQRPVVRRLLSKHVVTGHGTSRRHGTVRRKTARCDPVRPCAAGSAGGPVDRWTGPAAR